MLKTSISIFCPKSNVFIYSCKRHLYVSKISDPVLNQRAYKGKSDTVPDF